MRLLLLLAAAALNKVAATKFPTGFPLPGGTTFPSTGFPLPGGTKYPTAFPTSPAPTKSPTEVPSESPTTPAPTTNYISDHACFTDKALDKATATEIDCSNLGLTGPIPPTLFAGFSGLTSIKLNGNALTGAVPDTVGRFVNLNTLDLSDNAGLSGCLPRCLGTCDYGGDGDGDGDAGSDAGSDAEGYDGLSGSESDAEGYGTHEGSTYGTFLVVLG